MRMHRPKPNKLHDELDALLDGRPVELTDELAPLVEAADSLRAELASYELDPGVADRHLERVLEGSGTVVQLPVRQPAGGWDVRRRVVAVALAAALVLAPATIASAAALPGQAMYPFKLAIEQVRIASVQWSPGREAGERTRVADERLDEVEGLVEAKMFNQLPTAINALKLAVLAARDAVTEAQLDGAPVAKVAAKLDRVEGKGAVVVVLAASTANQALSLPGGIREAITTAVADSQTVLAPADREVGSTAKPPPTTGASQPAAGPSTQPESQPQPPPSGTTPPADPPTTETTPTTSPPTTDPPPVTTDPPPDDTGATPGSGP
ncbi:MAG TPA: hypothetical protein VG409_08400, partial [Actinomycetota bacterium]|nr:hypothetical protein [Actinomycetota bacterium]